jgi:hypothetical protein
MRHVSDAKVRFQRLDDWVEAKAGEEQTFSFNCPKADRRCEGLIIAGRTDLKRDGQCRNGGVAQWDWNGNREAPTFTPSVNCGRCWHGYIRGGRTVDCQGSDEPDVARTRT